MPTCVNSPSHADDAGGPDDWRGLWSADAGSADEAKSADDVSGEDGAGAFVGGVHRDPVDEEAPRVHNGFLRSLLESNLYDGVRDALRSLHAELGSTQQRLYVTGHSLGAAMAAMAAPLLLRDFAPPEIRLYTFGCPRTGNQVR